MQLLSCFKKSFSTLVALAVTGVGLNAQVLMLDFGPTVATGAYTTNSPYHSAAPSFTGSTWNTIGVGDTSSLVWSDGISANGLSLNLGATTTATATTINLDTAPSSSSALGGTTSTGIYAGTSVGTDGIFTGGSATSKRFVGFQLGGLAAGTYDIYVASRNTSTDTSYSQNLSVGTSAASGNFDAITLSLSESLSYTNGSTAISSWTEDGNYLKFTITIAQGDYLNLAATGGASGETRGFLNSVQIVAVPEPSTWALLAIGLVGAIIFRRRLAR